MSHYRIPREKSSPGRQFTGKNQPRPAAARAGGFIPVNCRRGETFLGAGDLIMGDFFCGPAIFYKGKISNRWLSLPGRIFYGGDVLIWHRPSESRWTDWSIQAAAAVAAGRSTSAAAEPSRRRPIDRRTTMHACPYVWSPSLWTRHRQRQAAAIIVVRLRSIPTTDEERCITSELLRLSAGVEVAEFTLARRHLIAVSLSCTVGRPIYADLHLACVIIIISIVITGRCQRLNLRRLF